MQNTKSSNVEQRFLRRQIDENSDLAPLSVTTVEATFMLRQGSFNDISASNSQQNFALSSTSNKNRSSWEQSQIERVPNLLPGYEALSEATKDCVAALERQVATLTAAITKKESEQERTEMKLRRTQSDLEACKRTLSTEKSEMMSKQELIVQQLKKQHIKEMVGITSSLSVSTPHSYSQSISGSISSDGGGISESHKQLLLQLDSMKMERRKMEESYSDDLRALHTESSGKLLSQERLFKAEISDLRWHKSSLEDRLSQLSEDFTIIHSKAEGFAQQIRSLEISRENAAEHESKLKLDYKILQQSISSSFGLDIGIPGSSTELTPYARNGKNGMDNPLENIESTLRLDEARSDAKIRQLTNKLDFLKSQLLSEQSSTEDFKLAVLREKSKIEELKAEFRMKMQEADQIKDNAVESAEKDVEILYMERMQELTSLQTKIMTLQGQLQVAYQDAAEAKQREETAKIATSKATVQQISLRAEIENLRGQLESQNDQREAEVFYFVIFHLFCFLCTRDAKPRQ